MSSKAAGDVIGCISVDVMNRISQPDLRSGQPGDKKIN